MKRRFTVKLLDFGDSAVLATVETEDSELTWRLVHQLADLLEERGVRGVRGIVPTYDSICVEFDCELTTHRTVKMALRSSADELVDPVERARVARRFRLPVVYGGEYGPDLDSLAEILGMSAERLVALHAGKVYVVRCLGAPIGSPLLDAPPFAQPVPRLPTPRTRVPAGSVSVAGSQTGVYPAEAPGGWRLIGRTPLSLMDVTRNPPVPYRPGDEFQFVPISSTEWPLYSGRRLEESSD